MEYRNSTENKIKNQAQQAFLQSNSAADRNEYKLRSAIVKREGNSTGNTGTNM
jgi:hypothetical protein